MSIWKPHKYGARKHRLGNHVFHSGKEAARYRDLKQQEMVGIISDLELQPKFELQSGFTHKGKRYRPIFYIADFRYKKDGIEIVEDVKGYHTDVYKLKKKLFLKKYNDINFFENKGFI